MLNHECLIRHRWFYSTVYYTRLRYGVHLLLSQQMTTIEIKDTAEGNETYYIELAIPEHTEDGAEVGKKCHSSVYQIFFKI